MGLTPGMSIPSEVAHVQARQASAPSPSGHPAG